MCDGQNCRTVSFLDSRPIGDITRIVEGFNLVNMPRMLVWQWGRFGSGPRFAFEFARALRESGNSKVLLSLAEGAEILQNQVCRDAVDLPVRTYNSIAQFAQRTLLISGVIDPIVRHIEDWRPDMAVLVMTGYWDIFLVRHLRRLGIPLMTVIHDAGNHPGDYVPILRWLERRVIRKSDAIITLTDFVAHQLRAQKCVKLAQHRTIAHPSFTFPDLVLEPSLPPGYPQRKPLRVLLAGRLRKYKGVELFLRAIASIDPALLSVRIAGSLPDRKLEMRARQLPHVELRPGWLTETDFVSQIEWADLVVLPYTEASQSGIIPTAYARGRPVVVTPVGGLSEQVVPGVTGLVARDVSSEAIKEAILQFVNRRNLVELCSLGAMSHADKKLNWEQFGLQCADYIADLGFIRK